MAETLAVTEDLNELDEVSVRVESDEYGAGDSDAEQVGDDDPSELVPGADFRDPFEQTASPEQFFDTPFELEEQSEQTSFSETYEIRDGDMFLLQKKLQDETDPSKPFSEGMGDEALEAHLERVRRAEDGEASETETLGLTGHTETEDCYVVIKYTPAGINPVNGNKLVMVDSREEMRPRQDVQEEVIDDYSDSDDAYGDAEPLEPPIIASSISQPVSTLIVPIIELPQNEATGPQPATPAESFSPSDEEAAAPAPAAVEPVSRANQAQEIKSTRSSETDSDDDTAAFATSSFGPGASGEILSSATLAQNPAPAYPRLTDVTGTIDLPGGPPANSSYSQKPQPERSVASVPRNEQPEVTVTPINERTNAPATSRVDLKPRLAEATSRPEPAPGNSETKSKILLDSAKIPELETSIAEPSAARDATEPVSETRQVQFERPAAPTDAEPSGGSEIVPAALEQTTNPGSEKAHLEITSKAAEKPAEINSQILESTNLVAPQIPEIAATENVSPSTGVENASRTEIAQPPLIAADSAEATREPKSAKNSLAEVPAKNLEDSWADDFTQTPLHTVDNGWRDTPGIARASTIETATRQPGAGSSPDEDSIEILVDELETAHKTRALRRPKTSRAAA